MKDDAFEYAIRKDVRNNPIVREVDRERYREMWRHALLAAFVVVVVVSVVWRHIELGVSDRTVDRLRQEKTKVDTENQHLRLELETLRSPARIEALAVGKLRMVRPGPGEHEVIERVMPTPPAPRTVVAQR